MLRHVSRYNRSAVLSSKAVSAVLEGSKRRPLLSSDLFPVLTLLLHVVHTSGVGQLAHARASTRALDGA